MLLKKSLTAACAILLCLQAQPAFDAEQAPGDWAQLKADGDAALDSRNYGKAEKLLVRALSQARRFGSADQRLEDTLHSLVTLYLAHAQFGKAEPLIEEELRTNEKILGAEHPQVVAQAGKLAEFSLQHGSQEKADRLAKLLTTFADRKLKEEQSLGASFTKLENWYKRDKVYAPAQAELLKLQEETRKAMGNENLEFAATFDSLAKLYLGTHKNAVAEPLLLKALALRQQSLPSNHRALAASYQNLGNLYRLQGRDGEADGYFKKALAITSGEY